MYMSEIKAKVEWSVECWSVSCNL